MRLYGINKTDTQYTLTLLWDYEFERGCIYENDPNYCSFNVFVDLVFLLICL